MDLIYLYKLLADIVEAEGEGTESFASSPNIVPW